MKNIKKYIAAIIAVAAAGFAFWSILAYDAGALTGGGAAIRVIAAILVELVAFKEAEIG
jgi:hypothetical protein